MAYHSILLFSKATRVFVCSDIVLFILFIPFNMDSYTLAMNELGREWIYPTIPT